MSKRHEWLPGIALLIGACESTAVPTDARPATLDGRTLDPVEDAGVDSDAPPSSAIAEPPSIEGASIVFGLPVTRGDRISSTFGPRWKDSASRTDFHPAIDWWGQVGDAVLAIGEGTVERVARVGDADFPSGGNVVVIAHTLPSPVRFHGQSLDRAYSVSMHLDTIAVRVGQAVRRGDLVGTMGETGDANFPHLHFELRLGAFCSFQYQSANPTSRCGLGFDPHVHPFVFLPAPNDDRIVLEDAPTSPGDAWTLRYVASRGDLDLDVITTNLGSIGFNTRAGMDARTLATLDVFRYGWMTLEPRPFTSRSDRIEYVLHFPTRPAYVEVRDVRGRGVRVRPSAATVRR